MKITYQLIWKYILLGFIPVILTWIFLVVKDWKNKIQRRKNLSFLFVIFTLIFYIILLFFILEVNISHDVDALEVFQTHKTVGKFEKVAAIAVLFLWWSIIPILISFGSIKDWSDKFLVLSLIKKKWPTYDILIIVTFILPLLFPLFIYPRWGLCLLFSMLIYIWMFAGLIILIPALLIGIILLIIGKVHILYLPNMFMPIILPGVYLVYFYVIYFIEQVSSEYSKKKRKRKEEEEKYKNINNKIMDLKEEGYDTSEMDYLLNGR